MEEETGQDCRQRILLAGLGQIQSNENHNPALEQPQGKMGNFEILTITSGEGNGWSFGSDILQRSLPLWEGVECFIDHDYLGWGAGRSVKDLAGIIYAPAWDPSALGIKATLRAIGPGGQVLTDLGKEILSPGASPAPNLGFSADVRFSAKGKEVQEILRVFSVDLVLDPARGGQFIRSLNQRLSEVSNMPDNPVTQIPEGSLQQNKLEAELLAVKEVRSQMCTYLLDSALTAASLPAALSERIRTQFQNTIFTQEQLNTAIEDARTLVSELTGPTTVQGPSRVTGVFDTRDQLQAATDDLLGAPRDESLKTLKIQKLSGIRELYLMLTGDDELHGGFYKERARLATTADFTGLVKNALNKIVVNTWDQLGRAGYDWWNQITLTEHFNSLNDITGTLVGTVGDLPVIEEGAEYTELPVGDSPEVASFVKYGGYIPLTLELIDRDQTRKLSIFARDMASAGLRKISKLVADIFSSNSGFGPIMADGGHLFNDSEVTGLGGHANYFTDALSQGTWDAACAAVYNQPMLLKSETGLYGTGPKMAINPKYCLVPRTLQMTARQILLGGFVNATGAFYDNILKGSAVPITVPDWIDANDWAAVCDPQLAPAIYIGERFGILPEVYIAGDELSPAVFTNDEHRLKVRHYLAVWVNDYRPLLKSIVSD